MERDYTIDIAKAIGIILMIIGHCHGLPWLFRNFIFSFHMPLFFIFSGYFYKPQIIKGLIFSGFKHLVRPYLITSLAAILLCVIAQHYDSAGKKIIGMMMSNGGQACEKYGSTLPLIGPIWFLLALFWCKIFYAYIKQRTNYPLAYSFIISVCAFIVGKYIVNLPFGILTGFCGMVFYAMGDYWKNKLTTPISCKYLIVGVIIWALCIWKSHLEIATFDCKHYPISMFAAFIGTYITYLVSKKTPRFIKNTMIWLGQNTLLILCYHTISFYIIPVITQYLLVPYDIKLSSVEKSVIISVLSLLLPYVHKSIQTGLVKKTAIAH